MLENWICILRPRSLILGSRINSPPSLVNYEVCFAWAEVFCLPPYLCCWSSMSKTRVRSHACPRLEALHLCDIWSLDAHLTGRVQRWQWYTAVCPGQTCCLIIRILNFCLTWWQLSEKTCIFLFRNFVIVLNLKIVRQKTNSMIVQLKQILFNTGWVYGHWSGPYPGFPENWH